MIKFNFLIALRSMFKNKVTSFINLFGLSVAFTALLLILLYVISELTYDRYHVNGDRVYRISRDGIDIHGKMEIPFGHVQYSLAVYLASDFSSDVEKVVRFCDNSNSLLSYGNRKSFVESRIFFADPGVFDVFSWKLIKGNATAALRELNTVVISESAARRYFDDADPIGKVLLMENETSLLVTGVYEDIPVNSHFKPDMLVSMSTREKQEGLEDLMRDQSNNDATYVMMKPGASLQKLEEQMPASLDKYYELLPDGRKSSQANRYHFWPLKDMHLYYTLDSATEPNGNYVMVYIFSATAILILLIACINFINLSTARLSQRAREVGLKKTIGAMRITLFIQFITEAFVFALFSAFLAIVAAYLLLPFFNSFIGKSLSLSMLAEPLFGAVLLLLLIMVSVVAGGYPAFYLSSFRASEVLKRGVSGSWKRLSVRSALVGFQFLLAFLLIISVTIVRKQMYFVNTYDVGFNRNSLLVLPSSPEIFKKFKSVKEQLEHHPGIQRVTLSSRVPSGRLADAQDAMIEANGQMKALDLRIADVHVDHDYFKVLGLPIVAGRDFDPTLSSDSLQAFILNETAVKNIGWKSNEEAIGKVFHYGSLRKGTVTGVVKDFNFESLHEPIKPAVFVITHGRARVVTMRIDEKQKDIILKYLSGQWTYWRPGFPFTWYSLSDNFEKQYEKERRIGKGVSFFAVFAVFVSSLGVFGLALFMAEQRSKEMGIRKVLGADVFHCMLLLGKWFFVLMALAGLVSIPLSYWLANNWLRTFAFAVEVGYAPYMIAFAIIALSTALSIVIQISRTAVQNPVNALRYE